MERHRFGNSDLTVSAIGLGCYGMSGVYGPADDAESIATIRRALDLGVNFLDTSASYGQGHNHRLIGEAIRGPHRQACSNVMSWVAGILEAISAQGAQSSTCHPTAPTSTDRAGLCQVHVCACAGPPSAGVAGASAGS